MTIYLHCEVVVSILYFNYQNYGFHHFVLHCKHAAHFARTKQEPTSMCSTPTLILILSYVIIRIIMFRELQNTSMLVHQVQTEPKTVHLSKIVDVFYTTVNFLDRSTQTSQVVGPPMQFTLFFHLVRIVAYCTSIKKCHKPNGSYSRRYHSTKIQVSKA